MRKITLLMLFFLITSFSAHATDPACDRTDVFLCESFNNLDFDSLNADGSPRTFTSVPASDFDRISIITDERSFDGSSLQIDAGYGGNKGIDFYYFFMRHPWASQSDAGWSYEPEEMWTRSYFMFDEDHFDPSDDYSFGGKNPILMPAGQYDNTDPDRSGGNGGERTADGTTGWSARGGYGETNPDGTIPLHTYNYNYEIPRPSFYGDADKWKHADNSQFNAVPGVWYGVETYFKLNDPDQFNGILKIWVDGELVLDMDDLSYRSIPTNKIEGLWANYYLGGLTAEPWLMRMYVDNFAASETQRIGLMDACDVEGEIRFVGSDVGECFKAQQECQEGTWREIVPGQGPVEEILNQKDDDCDGLIDNSETPFCNPGDSSECYTGPAGTLNVGSCRAGTRTCGDDGRWTSCTDITPQACPSAQADPQDINCDGLFQCPLVPEGANLYTFDNSNNLAEDLSDAGIDGTVVGDVDYIADGLHGASVGFDGSGHISLPSSVIGSVGSLSLFLRHAEGTKAGQGCSTNQDIIQSSVSGNFFLFRYVGCQTVNAHGLRMRKAFGTEREAYGFPMTDELLREWNHLLVTWDYDRIKFYFNGEQVGDSPSSPDELTTNNVIIGNEFNGQIDDLSFWNRVLTAEEVLDIYNTAPLAGGNYEVGDTRNCGTNVGECVAGTQTYDGTSWSVCNDIGPSPETCDSLDNDCDGQIDEEEVCVTPSVCGNDIVETGEQCDDGNVVDGDGCSSTCQTEIVQDSCLPEDVNNDDTVNVFDLLTIVGVFGTTDPTGDVTSDGIVNVFDLLSVAGKLGQTSGDCDPPVGEGNGLLGEYFNNDDLTDFVLSRVDSTIDFDWGSASPDSSIDSDTFSVRWTGQVNIPTSGEWTFIPETNDGHVIYINGNRLVNGDEFTNNHGPAKFPASLTLSEGLHDIRLEMREGQVTAYAKLYWSGPGVSEQIIPQQYLFSTPPECTDIDGDSYCSELGDCNDNNAAIHPGAEEICGDGIDNDCKDGDEPVQTFYVDSDGDSYGTDSVPATQACSLPAEHSTNANDCNDNNAAIHPGASDICDVEDRNCDNIIQECGTGFFGTLTPKVWTHWDDTSLTESGALATSGVIVWKQEAIFSAWSGGTHDTLRNRILATGGGHADYDGNEVYAFDIETGTWSRIWGPSGQSPPSVHSYDGLIYDPVNDMFIRAGGSVWSPGGSSTNDVWGLNLQTLQSFQLGETPSRFGLGASSVYVPEEDKIWLLGASSAYTADISGTTITFEEVWSDAIGSEEPSGNGEWNSQESYMLVNRGPLLHIHERIDGDVERSELSVSGPTECLQNDGLEGPGLVYYQEENAFVCFSNKDNLGVIRVDKAAKTATITDLNIGGGPSVVRRLGEYDGDFESKGHYGRMALTKIDGRNVIVLPYHIDADVAVVYLPDLNPLP